MHYAFVLKYLDAVPKVEPAAVDTILEMTSHSRPVQAKLFDNSIICLGELPGAGGQAKNFGV